MISVRPDSRRTVLDLFGARTVTNIRTNFKTTYVQRILRLLTFKGFVAVTVLWKYCSSVEILSFCVCFSCAGDIL